jgi:hypothetical protein
MYRGSILKSRDGIPCPVPPLAGMNLAREAATARARFYPVTIAYTAYALTVLALGVRSNPGGTILAILVGVISWTLIEYLVHRYVLHGKFPDGPGGPKRLLHVLFDPSHGDHHERPWDGRHINGGFATVPFAFFLAMASFLGPLPATPVFVATILLSYVVEEWIHYSVHFHRLPGRYFAYIRRHHLYHHGPRGREVAFGLSSGVWDVPLGTGISPRDRGVLDARSPRAAAARVVAMLAVAVTCGSLHAEAQGPGARSPSAWGGSTSYRSTTRRSRGS